MLRILHDTNVRLHQVLEDGRRSARSRSSLLGLVLLGVHAARHNGDALNYSVEFTGGTVVQLQFAQAARRPTSFAPRSTRRASAAPRSRRSATPRTTWSRCSRRPGEAAAVERRQRRRADRRRPQAAACRAIRRTVAQARGRRPARRLRAEDQGDHRDPHLVHRHADLSRDSASSGASASRRRSRRCTTSSRRWRSSP